MAIDRIYDGVLRGLEAFGLRRPRPRQARLYCVGAPRTGTHSIAAIFDRSIRSGHEPAFRAATKAVLAHHRGRLSFDDLRTFVGNRDARLRLDVDSSHVNVFLIDAILAEFADARFLLTIRDCYSWTDSAMNHTLNSRGWSKADRDYLEFYFAAQHLEYSPHDAFLRRLGLPSLDAYLTTWRRHNERALASSPPERLLVVRTPEISTSLPQIAEFAGIAKERLAPAFTARGTARARHGVLEKIDAAYLEDRVAEHCGPLMRRFFPQVRSRREALAMDSAPQ
jgi:hypothetical protein